MEKKRPRGLLHKIPEQVVFLHIAKTAGTSLVHFLRKHIPSEQVCTHGDFLGWPDDPELRA